MGALGGIVNFLSLDGESNEHFSRCLDALDRRLAWLGPDGSHRFLRAPVAMLYRPFHTTRESVLDRQPLDSTDLAITFNGRLDNFGSLRVDLGLDERATHSEVVQHAYRRWDSRCFEHLIGDYAIALWDWKCCKLLLARDPIGTRPLYYLQRDGRVCWASMADAVLTSMDEALEVDRQYVAAYLSFEQNPFLSPFRHVAATPPGHVVVINSQRATTARFWNIRDYMGDQEPMPDEEYEERFRSLFFSAVRNRLRADRPVVAQLSGGLDSSSIVSVADAIVKCDKDLTPKLMTVSHVFDRAWKSDEREFIGLIEAHRGVPGIHLKEDDAPILGCCPDPKFVSFPNPVFFTGAHVTQLLDAMRLLGTRVILSGHAGDHVLMSEEEIPLELADFLHYGHPISMLKHLLPWCRATRVPILELVWSAAMRPCIRSSMDPCPVRTPPWMHSKLRQDAGESVRPRNSWNRASGLPPSKKVFCAAIEDAIGIVASGHCGFYTTLGRIEMRFPYLDRTLVEFLASIPTQQLCRPGENRSLQRRALRDVLPAKIAKRTSKGVPEHAITIAIRTRYEPLRDLIKKSVACERQYVDGEAILAELNRARHGASIDMMAFLRFISLEFWLCAIEYRPAWAARELISMTPRLEGQSTFVS